MKKKYLPPMGVSFSAEKYGATAVTATNLRHVIAPERFHDRLERAVPCENELFVDHMYELGVHGNARKDFRHVMYYHTDHTFDVEWCREDVPFFDFFINHRLGR